MNKIDLVKIIQNGGAMLEGSGRGDLLLNGGRDNKMKFKYGRAWAIDGSFYTEDKKTIESFLAGLYTPGKKDYTITDENGNAIALLQIDY